MASTIARHNVSCTSDEAMQEVAHMHKKILDLLNDTKHKPAVVHSDPEHIRLALDFVDRIKLILQYANQSGKMQPQAVAATQQLITYSRERIRKSHNEKGGRTWYIDPQQLVNMYGIHPSDQHACDILQLELDRWKEFSPYDVPHALTLPVSDAEVKRLFLVIRDEIFALKPFDAHVYTDSQSSQHYLFWSPVSGQQECAVPTEFSMCDYLRFDCPHNHMHLAHLYALKSEGAKSYMDYMDERAFFEAVAVHAEWVFFDTLLQNREHITYALHSQFEPKRSRGITADELGSWLICSRGYEFRLRAMRLLADILTIENNLSFEEMIQRSAHITGLPHKDVEAEARKYYFLTGLGAMYSLGYRRLLDNGIHNTMEAFYHRNDEDVCRMWHQFY